MLVRALLIAAVALLVAGCTAQPPAVVQDVPDDGSRVTAVRVEPLTHTLDEAGTLYAQPCLPLSAACAGAGGLVDGGLAWPQPVFAATDAAALFWRVQLDLGWQSPMLRAVDARLQVAVTTPCGIGCVEERVLDLPSTAGPNGHLLVGPVDVYLLAGETGLRVHLVTGDLRLSSQLDPAEYTLTGTLQGFRAVGAPIILA